MYGKVKPENLTVYLEKINKLFPEFRSGSEITLGDVERYYSESYWGYAVFHSWSGAIHMALSPDGTFSKSDYFRQAEEVATALGGLSAEGKLSVLEVGCGRGFNMRYLAEAFSNATFLGVDISERNLASAQRLHSDIGNVKFKKSDFHFLAEVPDASVDVVFAVETLCHATRLDFAAQAITRVLKNGGLLVVFDGFRGPSFRSFEVMATAVTYAEKAMAVPAFKEVEDFVKAFECAGLVRELVEDRSKEIMPNLIRLSDFAKSFFKINFLSRLFLAILPRGLVANSVAGLLMAVTVQSEAHRYMKVVFKKSVSQSL